MSLFRADLHVHTDASGDGRSTLARQAAAARAAGLDAMAVTDHDRCTPVPERMEGVLLIPGCEISTTLGHITGLFLARPVDMVALEKPRSPEAAVRAIHEAGGLAVLAHPYELREPDRAGLQVALDGMETANARADLKDAHANEKAAALAAELGLAPVGGSDGHHAKEVGNAYTELEAAELTLDALRAALAGRRCRAVLVRRTGWVQKGLSQWRAARRHGPRRQIHGLLYLGKCLWRAMTEKLRGRT